MHAAVGHVERFNPALLELRRRVRERPARRGLPDRHRAHRPVPGPRARRRRRQGPRHPRPRPRPLARRRAGRAPRRRRPSTAWAASTRTSCWSPGASASGVAFNCVVDWLSPTKVRRTRVLGERGMLVADTLTADLTFYANGDVDLGVGGDAGAARRQRGRHDALRAGPPRAAAGRARGVRRPARAATTARRRRHARRRAWRPSCSPRPCCASAAARRDGRPRGRRVKAVVVALGKIGLPLAARSRAPGTRSSAATSTRASSTLVNAGRAAVPGRGRACHDALAEVVADGRLRAADGHDRGGRRGAGPGRRRAAADGRRATREPDWRILDAVVADIGRGLQAGTDRVASRRRVPVGTTREPHRPRAGGRQRPAGRAGLLHRLQPRARLQRPRLRATSTTYPKLVGGLTADGEARAAELYAAVPRRRGLADGLGRGGRADEARRDDLPRRQHRASPTSSRATPTRSASTSTA